MSVYVDMWIMSRTFRIRYGEGVGTCFYARIGTNDFILTAKHLVQGLVVDDSIALRNNDGWQYLAVESVAFCAHGSDVAAIKMHHHFGEAIHQDQLSPGINLGEDIAYCGFPLGLENEALPDAPQWPVPLVKGGIMSGARQRNGVRVFLFDSVNNPGFSGGPILRRDQDGLKVVAIVSGYEFDAPLPIEQRNEAGEFVRLPDYRVRPNSGFMIGTPINMAIGAANQING